MLDVQGIMTQGANVSGVAEPYQRARAKSQAMATALRYAHRPNLQTRWQAALTVAWKNYPDISDTRSVALVPSFVWRAGSGVEVMAQYRYVYNGDGLATVNGQREQQVLVGLNFNFATTFNESVGSRSDILNFEHNMLDLGPVSGGH